MSIFAGWSQQQIEAGVAELREAIASGALNVKFGERSVTYRSLAEMRSVLTEMTAALGTIDTRPRVRTLVLRDRSGW